MVVGMTLEVSPGPATGPGARAEPDAERHTVADCGAPPSAPPAPAEPLPFIWLG